MWTGSIFKLRDREISPPAVIRDALIWSVMGDLNSNCEPGLSFEGSAKTDPGYRPQQDIVIPARTCLQDDLRETFGDIRSIRPIRQRSVLASFKGSVWGAGTGVRRKVMCERNYEGLRDTKLSGGTAMKTYWGGYAPGGDYLSTLNETVFCPLPRGITGTPCPACWVDKQN